MDVVPLPSADVLHHRLMTGRPRQVQSGVQLVVQAQNHDLEPVPSCFNLDGFTKRIVGARVQVEELEGSIPSELLKGLRIFQSAMRPHRSHHALLGRCLPFHRTGMARLPYTCSLGGGGDSSLPPPKSTEGGLASNSGPVGSAMTEERSHEIWFNPSLMCLEHDRLKTS